jgi:hypothetical protein
MQKTELFDETFDHDRSESYELSIQVSLNGFLFCINDTTRNLYIGLVSFPFDYAVKQADDWPTYIKRVHESYPWLSNRFKKVKFCFESPSYTIVPKEFFVPEKGKQLLMAVHRIDTFDEIWHNNFQEDIVSIFNIPSILVSEWLKIQKETRFIGYCDPVISFQQLGSSNSQDPTITVSLSSSFAIVIVSRGTKLLHCGSIIVVNPEDTVYHMVNICQKLNLTVGNVAVKFLGIYDDIDRIESLVDRYFLSSKRASTLEHNHFSYLLNKHKGKYANLFNQSLCE